MILFAFVGAGMSAMVGCVQRPTSEELEALSSAGCDVGSEDAAARGAEDGSACADESPRLPDDYFDQAVEACDALAKAKTEMPDPCISAWQDGFEACFDASYSESYNVAAAEAGCP